MPHLLVHHAGGQCQQLPLHLLRLLIPLLPHISARHPQLALVLHRATTACPAGKAGTAGVWPHAQQRLMKHGMKPPPCAHVNQLEQADQGQKQGQGQGQGAAQ